ncbi:MAG TPA: metal-dependent hydrolase [Cyanothece sp. UBA12306]|nr:metal-dependent hydrolase [Cyanothece sp. UBA12306]
MMALTHSVIAAASVSFALGEVSPLVTGLAIIGSQLPDLDTSTSLIGQVCFPISSFIEDRFPHRSITHSFLATVFFTLLSFPLFYFGYLPLKAWLALPLGHLVACFSDTFTKQGVQLFFPNPVWCVCGSNPNRRLTTGSPAEYWVLAGAVALLVVNMKLMNAGGLVQTASQQLGLKTGILNAYNASAQTHHVYAEVDGVLAIDSREADGKYFIIGVEGSEFIVQQGEDIFKTGSQLITNRLTTTVGGSANTIIQTLSFNDEDAIESLQQLNNSYPNAAIYLTGNLTIDFPEEVKIKIEPEEYTVIELTGSSLKLSWCPVSEALSYLKDQYAVGTLTAKIITPRPF